MNYVTLYRRWRPQDFDALVGQETVKQGLSNAAKSGHIAHAYLFSGPRGTGKTSTARIFAKALNCEKGPTDHPCGKCSNCVSITEGTSMDVLEIDAASNRGIDNIKELREKINFAPVDGKYKVYIIDEVHMLTTEAFNGLLKTLEEPPENVVFILATTDAHKVPSTIHSRCQRFDFHRLTVDEITKHLVMVAKKSDIVADEDALRLIAVQAEGGLRDALGFLDQCAVINPRVTADLVRDTLGIVGRECIREMVKSIGEGDGAKVIETAHKLLAMGRDGQRILGEMTDYFRAILMYKNMPGNEEPFLVDEKEFIEANAKLFDSYTIMDATEYIVKGLRDVRNSFQPRVFLELTLLHLCYLNKGAQAPAAVQPVNNQVVQQAPKVQVKPAVAAQPGKEKPVEKPKAQVKPKAASEAVKDNVKDNVKAEPVKVKEEQTVAAAPFAPAPASAADIKLSPVGLGTKYWNEALDFLTQEGKIAISSCARHGKVVAYDGKVLTVLCPVYLSSRLGEDDYKHALEDAILRMQRVAVVCKFVSEFDAPKEELPEMVKTAMDVFGGTVIKEE